MPAKLFFLAPLLFAEILISSDILAASKPAVRWKILNEKAVKLSESRYLIEKGDSISLCGSVDGEWNRGAPMTVEFANAIDKKAQPLHYAAIVDGDGSFIVACSPPPATYAVRAITPNGDRSEAITLLYGQQMHVLVEQPFKPDTSRRDNAEVDEVYTAEYIPSDRQARIRVDVPADTGDIRIIVTRNGAPDEPLPFSFTHGNALCPIDLKVTNNFQPVDLVVSIAWRATGDKDFQKGEKLNIKANPLLRTFKVTGGYRDERSAAPNFKFKESLFDAGSSIAPAKEISTANPLLKIEAQPALQSVQSLDVVVTAEEKQILEGLEKAEMKTSETITLTVQNDGTFDSEQDSKKNGGKPVMLFPGKNTLTVSTSVNGQKVELEQLSVNSKPLDGTELWAWLHWTGNADVDLHVIPVMSRNVRAKTKDEDGIYWKTPEVRGIPARMLSWGSVSGTPEVFVVERRSAEVSDYEFYAKPDEGETNRSKAGKLEPARLLFVLWTKETKTYRTESERMTFDNFPKEIPKVTFMNQSLP